MIETLKTEIIQLVKSLSIENVNDSLFIISKQMKLIEDIIEYQNIKNESILFKVPENVSTVPITLMNKSENKRGEKNKNNQYLFERKIRGGLLPEIEAFVPEGIVRKLELKHGDLLYAEKVVDGEESHYFYRVAERVGIEDLTIRSQFNLCPVEKEGEKWLVKKSLETNDLIRNQDIPYTAILNPQDVHTNNLQVGDLIDIAFFNNNPQNVKVIWKHSIEDIPKDKSNVENKVKKPVKEKFTSNSNSTIDIPKSLQGETILIIGNEPDKQLYKAEIENRGGKMLWADAKENTQRLRSLVKKSEKVIFLLKVGGHTGMKQIKKFCKQYNKQMIHTWDLGVATISGIAADKSQAYR